MDMSENHEVLLDSNKRIPLVSPRPLGLSFQSINSGANKLF